MFSCEMCGNALRGYLVTFQDSATAEVCGDCLEFIEESEVVKSERFAGLRD